MNRLHQSIQLPDLSVAARHGPMEPWYVLLGGGGQKPVEGEPCDAWTFCVQQNRVWRRRQERAA